MAHPLESVRLKISRAADHANELQREVIAWGKRNPYGQTGQYDADSGTYVFRYRIYEPPPDRWGVLMGDVIHNLSSTLEHLAWQLVIHNNCVPIEGQTGFPIVTEASNWEGQTRLMEGMSDFHKTAIHWYQPYGHKPPSEHPLAILRELWNVDKHRTLTPMLGRLSGGHMTVVVVHDIVLGSASVPPFIPVLGPVEDDAEIVRVPCTPKGPNPKVHLKGEVPLDVVFGEGLGPVGKRIDETLRSVYQCVEGIFQEFARDFR